MTRPGKDGQLRRGAITLALLFLLFIALFVASQTDDALAPRATLFADFRTVGGLRRGSGVELAGVSIGTVESIDFVNTEYACDPLTEDIGRHGSSRTDDCESSLFCAPVQMCADLEAWSAKQNHLRCVTDADCVSGEICVTGAFRRHAPKLEWSGPNGVCARYMTQHWRARAKMEILERALALIGTGSLASIGANRLLGDQVVMIRGGHPPPIPSGTRLQTEPSFMEDIERYRQRLVRLLHQTDDALLAISNVIEQLRDERTIRALKGTVANLQVITYRLAYGKGILAALLSDPDYRDNVGATVSSLTRISGGLVTATQRANSILATIDHNIKPVLADLELSVQALNQLLADLDDPNNPSLMSKALRDWNGSVGQRLADTIHNTAEITNVIAASARALDQGTGTLGKLVNDPFLIDHVGTLLQAFANRPFWRKLLIIYLKMKDFDVGASKDPAGPR